MFAVSINAIAVFLISLVLLAYILLILTCDRRLFKRRLGKGTKFLLVLIFIAVAYLLFSTIYVLKETEAVFIQETVLFVIALLGLVSSVKIFSTKKKFTIGPMQKMFEWLLLGIFFSSLFYALLRLSSITGVLTPGSSALELSMDVLLLLLFIYILRMAQYAEEVGACYGFKEQEKRKK
jgi:magnesium-transporting ATPase (P-type)